MLTPLYTEPFLAVKEPEENKIMQDLNISVIRYNSSISQYDQNNSLHYINSSGDTNVHYAFLITGILSVVVSLPFVFLYFKDQSERKSCDEEESGQTVYRKVPVSLHIFMVTMIGVFYFAYCCVEDTFASYLMTFVVSEYDSVTKSKGASITAFYWAFFALGRFLSIFVARFLKAVQLMYLCSVIMTVAFSAFLISAHFAAIDALTVCGGFAGVGMSAMFPACMSWAEAELMQVTSWVSSWIFVASSMGMMVNPMIIGYLMEEVDNMWFCYVMVIETVLTVAIFLFLLIFNRCYVDKKYGRVNPPLSIEGVPATESERL